MRAFLLLCCLLFLLPQPADARERIAGPLAAEVLEVLDGDTVAVRLHIWLGQSIETFVRIDGIDTPEKRGKCDAEREKAQEARNALAALLHDKKVYLSDIRHGKYAGRVLAKASTASGTDIAQTLVSLGHARPYRGGKRAGWCS